MSEIIKLAEFKDRNDACIFKSLEEAKRFASNQQRFNDERVEIDVICLQAINNESLLESIISLSKQYECLIFIKDKNNFCSKELIEYCHHVDTIIYESPNQDPYLDRAETFYISEILQGIKNSKSSLFGYDCALNDKPTVGRYLDFFSFDNKVIKIYSRKTFGIYSLYFKVVTNYSLYIKKIIVDVDENYQEEHNLEFEVVDSNGYSFSFELPGKKKNNLEYFRQKLSQKGNFFDCFTKAEFNQLLYQLCSVRDYPVVYKYNRPGLISDKNVWLLADEVISLED